MTSDEIVKRIVEAEGRFYEIYNEAVKLQDGFPDYIKSHMAKLRSDAFAAADSEIAAAKAEEKARADSAVAELNEKQAYEMNRAKAVFEAQRQAVAERMYELVVEKMLSSTISTALCAPKVMAMYSKPLPMRTGGGLCQLRQSSDMRLFPFPKRLGRRILQIPPASAPRIHSLSDARYWTNNEKPSSFPLVR